MKYGENGTEWWNLGDFGVSGAFSRLGWFLGPRNASPGRAPACYLGTSRNPYCELAIWGGGEGEGGDIFQGSMRGRRGSPVKDAPHTPSGMYGAEISVIRSPISD